MILIDREDVDRLGLWPKPFMTIWNPDDPVQWAEGSALDFPDVPAAGPFLLVVNDEYAWAGQRMDLLDQVAQKRADAINRRWWRPLAEKYVNEMGITHQSFILRFSRMRRRLTRNLGTWYPWDEIHHWSDDTGLMWSAVFNGRDPSLQAREFEGQRQVRCV